MGELIKGRRLLCQTVGFSESDKWRCSTSDIIEVVVNTNNMFRKLYNSLLKYLIIIHFWNKFTRLCANYYHLLIFTKSTLANTRGNHRQILYKDAPNISDKSSWKNMQWKDEFLSKHFLGNLLLFRKRLSRV